jgi:leader peptidase (prepilin peptidase)/N-methyltransferase
MVYVLVFLIGLSVGSFMNVCIYRIPSGESIVTGSSHCTSCRIPIKWYDLIPVLSYILLKGRCRNCKSSISIRYPIVEFANGAAWLAFYCILDLGLLFLMVSIIFSVLLVVTIIVYDSRKT